MFEDYKVFIYENNSTDNTSALLSQWAAVNPKISFISETLPDCLLQLPRTEKIARARNNLLNEIRKNYDSAFDYLIMADLDIPSSWPII